MRHPKLTVAIDIGDGDPVYICQELDSFQVLDIPALDADHFDRSLCTPAETILLVMKDRDLIAQELEVAIINAVMAALSSKDTEMGYPKKQNREAMGK